MRYYSSQASVFTNPCFCSLHGDGNSIDFKNLHCETHFHKFAFSGPQSVIIVNERPKRIKSFPFLVTYPSAPYWKSRDMQMDSSYTYSLALVQEISSFSTHFWVWFCVLLRSVCVVWRESWAERVRDAWTGVHSEMSSGPVKRFTVQLSCCFAGSPLKIKDRWHPGLAEKKCETSWLKGSMKKSPDEWSSQEGSCPIKSIPATWPHFLHRSTCALL